MVRKITGILILLFSFIIIIVSYKTFVTLRTPDYRCSETVNAESHYPQGPRWFKGGLHYVEYGTHRVMRWNKVKNITIWEKAGCGPASIIRTDDTSLLVACYDSNSIVKISPEGKTLSTKTLDNNNKPFSGPNDFEHAPEGGVFFSASGTFDAKSPARGSLYYITPEGVIRKIADDLHYPNGIAVINNGKRLIVSEHLSRRVTQYDIVESGSLKNRKVFADLRNMLSEDLLSDPYTGPDGIMTDPAGNIYICLFGASRVLVLNRKAAVLRSIKVPERYVTNIAMGESPGIIYITAVSDAWKAPYLGKVYRFKARLFPLCAISR